MNQRKRLKIWFFAGITLLALLILAASIPNLRFKSGYRIRFRDETEELPEFTSSGQVLIEAKGADAFFRITAYILLGCAVLLIILAFIIPQTRKRIIWAVVIILIASVLLFIRWELPPREEASEQSLAPEAEYEHVYPDTYRPDEFSGTVSETTVIIFSVVFVTMIGWLAYVIWRKVQRNMDVSPMKELGEDAQTALGRLGAGADVRSTVLRCYYEMCRVVSNRRNIRRKTSMTPREFEGLLLEVGFPESSVHGITRLFERVRYGEERLDPEEEQEATHCLQSIQQICGEEK